MVQWLRLCTPNAGFLGSIPGGELDLLGDCMPQVKILKIPPAATKARCSQIIFFFFLRREWVRGASGCTSLGAMGFMCLWSCP